MYDVLIIGAGISGMTAAIYCLRAGLNVAIIEKSVQGGQISITNEIENYPGFSKISGPELAMSTYEQVKNLGCKFIYDEIKNVKLKDSIKILKSEKNTYECKSVIIAVGIQRKKFGCKGEEKLIGHGVSYCATCDGSFYKNKDVLIVGGGNTALEDALFLSNICNRVIIVVRKSYFKGEKTLVDSVLSKPNIEIKTEHVLEEIIGENRVSAARIKDINTQESNIFPIDGAFIAIVYEPNNKIFADQVEVTEYGYFKSDENCKTNIEAVFVVGDCRDKPLRQIVTAASDGAIAANQLIMYLNTKNTKQELKK